jgi:hypothetical protein
MVSSRAFTRRSVVVSCRRSIDCPKVYALTPSPAQPLLPRFEPAVQFSKRAGMIHGWSGSRFEKLILPRWVVSFSVVPRSVGLAWFRRLHTFSRWDLTNLAVAEEALSLSPAERADLARLLIQSLEDDSRTDWKSRTTWRNGSRIWFPARIRA